jgi:hypothetical protein
MRHVSASRMAKIKAGEACSTCGTNPPRAMRKTCQRCADLIRDWRKRNPDRHRKVAKAEHQRNKAQYRVRERRWFAADPNRQVNKRIRRTIGDARFGVELYQQILTAQKNRCRICGAPPNGKRLFIDHEHVSGRLRGLLCSNCNCGIGLFKDNPGRLRAAADYIEGKEVVNWMGFPWVVDGQEQPAPA